MGSVTWPPGLLPCLSPVILYSRLDEPVDNTEPFDLARPFLSQFFQIHLQVCRPKLYSVPKTESFVNDALAEKMSLRDRTEGKWKSEDIKGVVQGEDHEKPESWSFTVHTA